MIFLKKNKPKIFCISIQRTGTTSVGDFFESFGFKRSGWPTTLKNNWGRAFFDGDFESIFNSKDFRDSEIFEDGPWSVGHFYKVLFHRFPDARFVLFTRDADAWFDSMVSHSKGKTLGNTFRHCCNYQRETEYYNFVGDNHQYSANYIDNLLPITEAERMHYKEIYVNRNRQAIDFFNSKDPNFSRFIHLELEDEKKWIKLSDYFKINVKQNIDIHSNKSKNKYS
jgi:hypothetical protein